MSTIRSRHLFDHGGEGAARVLSVNVGLPREVDWRGDRVVTGIFKDSVAGPVRVVGAQMDGDGQADPTVHGGPDKAVYVYPAEHYPAWERELGRALPWGLFGENLTVEGMPLEDEIAIGDRWRIGTAEFTVTQPRLPCYKLGIRFGDAGMVRRFLASGRSGYYLRTEQDGVVAAGDPVEVMTADPHRVPVSEVTRLFTRDRHDAEGIHRVLAVPALPADWRLYFEEAMRR